MKRKELRTQEREWRDQFPTAHIPKPKYPRKRPPSPKRTLWQILMPRDIH